MSKHGHEIRLEGGPNDGETFWHSGARKIDWMEAVKDDGPVAAIYVATDRRDVLRFDGWAPISDKARADHEGRSA